MNDANVQSLRRLLILTIFALLLAAFWLELQSLPLARELSGSVAAAFAGFALLLAPLWFFAFGAGERLRAILQAPWLRVAAPALLAVPYVLYALPMGEFQWRYAVALLIAPVVLGGILEWAPKVQRLLWQDAVVLLALWLTLELGLLSGAWPHPGLGVCPSSTSATLHCISSWW